MRGGGEEKKGGISRIRPPHPGLGRPLASDGTPFGSCGGLDGKERRGCQHACGEGKSVCACVCVRVCLCARDRGIETSEAPCGLGQHF